LPTCQETQGKFRTNARKIPDKRKGKSQQTQGSKQAQGTVQTNTRDSAEEVLNPPVQRAFSAKGVKHPTYDLELVRTNDHKPFFVFQDLVQYRSTAYPGSPQIGLPQQGPITKRQCGDPPSHYLTHVTPGLSWHPLGSLHRPGST